jgi:hypothetical protein
MPDHPPVRLDGHHFPGQHPAHPGEERAGVLLPGPVPQVPVDGLGVDADGQPGGGQQRRDLAGGQHPRQPVPPGARPAAGLGVVGVVGSGTGVVGVGVLGVGLGMVGVAVVGPGVVGLGVVGLGVVGLAEGLGEEQRAGTQLVPDQRQGAFVQVHDDHGKAAQAAGQPGLAPGPPDGEGDRAVPTVATVVPGRRPWPRADGGAPGRAGWGAVGGLVAGFGDGQPTGRVGRDRLPVGLQSGTQFRGVVQGAVQHQGVPAVGGGDRAGQQRSELDCAALAGGRLGEVELAGTEAGGGRPGAAPGRAGGGDGAQLEDAGVAADGRTLGLPPVSLGGRETVEQPPARHRITPDISSNATHGYPVREVNIACVRVA